MHKNVKGTRKIPKCALREFFGSKLLKNEKLPKNLSFSGVYGGFSFAVSEEGRELYDNALRFFEALRDMPMFHVIEQECKRNWINSAAYKSAKSSGRYSGKKSLKSSGDVDEELVCDDEVGDVDERFVRSFYNEDEDDEYEANNLGQDAGNMSEGHHGGDSDDDGSGFDDDD